MKLRLIVALAAALLVSIVSRPQSASAQELFGVHVVAVSQPHSPVQITEFTFGTTDDGWRGPRITVMNQSNKQVESFQLEIQYLAPKGCNVLGTPDAPYNFITVEGADPEFLRSSGLRRRIPPGLSAESSFDFKADGPFSFLSGNPSAHFPLNLKTGYLHVQVKVTSVSFEGGSSWPGSSGKRSSKIEREKLLYDHDAYDEDRVDCNLWKPVMDRLNENMKWTDVKVVDPHQLKQLGAGLVQTSHGDSAEFLYTCAFTESETFVKATKRAAFVCPDLSK